MGTDRKHGPSSLFPLGLGLTTCLGRRNIVIVCSHIATRQEHSGLGTLMGNYKPPSNRSPRKLSSRPHSRPGSPLLTQSSSNITTPRLEFSTNHLRPTLSTPKEVCLRPLLLNSFWSRHICDDKSKTRLNCVPQAASHLDRPQPRRTLIAGTRSTQSSGAIAFPILPISGEPQGLLTAQKGLFFAS